MFTRKWTSGTKTLGIACTLVAALAGCQSPEEAVAPVVLAIDPIAEAAPPECSESFIKIIEPLQINGGHHLYFEPAQVSFFADPALRILSVQLKASVRGKLKGDAFEVPLALNGLQTSGRDGSSIYELIRYVAQSDSSEIRHHVHKMVVNGAEPIQNFMLKVLKNNGTIKLSLQGKDLHVLSANLEVNGYSLAACGSDPDPDPTPPPTATLPALAPTTSIVSANPAASVTSSSAISISFESDQLGSAFQCSLDGAALENCASPQAYSGLGDGEHFFRVVATNAAGIIDPAGASYAWSVNSALPGAALDNLSELPSVSSSSSIQFSFSQAGASGYQCSIDGGEFTPCSSPAVYSELGEGLHQFAVTSIDSSGNVASNPAEFQWVIDFTAPISSIIEANPASASSNSASMVLAFMANEPAEFECSVDGSGFMACSSPHALSGLSEGEHQFEVRARDVAGNLGLPISYAWNIDLSAPVMSLGQASPPEGFTNSRQIAVEFSANELASFSCSFDGSSFESCSSPFVAPIFAEGNHALSVIAIDPAGNQSAPLHLEWLMDFSSPEISFLEITPSSASVINSQWLNASIYSSEAVILVAKLNDVDLGQSSSPIRLSGLAEGAYSLLVSALDGVGNVSNSIAHSFSVDLTAPEVSLSAQYSGLTNSTSNTISISSSEPASFECQLNGAGFASCGSSLALSGLAEGNHVVEVRAKDLAGNAGSIASLAWAVDLTPPVVTLTVQRTQNASIQFSFTPNEADSVFFCSLDNAAFSACVSPVSYAGVAVGGHSFAVKAQDPAGNTGAPASHAWAVDPAVNTYIAGASPAASPTRQNSIAFTFGSNVGLSFRCSLDGAALSACSSPMNYAGLGDGVHQFRVHAVDRWGTQDPVGASYSWTIDTTPPVVGTISTSTTSTSITITWTTNEPATSALNWGVGYDTSRVVAPNGNYVTSHSIKLTGLMPNTLYSYIVSGSDAAGNSYSAVRKSIRTNY